MLYGTRANIHVDRVASAWLIKNFVDPQAEFVFVLERGCIIMDGLYAALGNERK